MNHSQISDIGLPLERTKTWEHPTPDPGISFKLKRTDSGRECFAKLDPYISWLTDLVHANNWLPMELAEEFQDLYNDFRTKEKQFWKVPSLQEFFSQSAHVAVWQLFEVYKDIRKRIFDMGTKRVTLRRMQIARMLADTSGYMEALA